MWPGASEQFSPPLVPPTPAPTSEPQSLTPGRAARGALVPGGHVVVSLLTEDPWFQKGALGLSCPLQVYVLTSRSPGPQDVTAFGESIFKELIKVLREPHFHAQAPDLAARCFPPGPRAAPLPARARPPSSRLCTPGPAISRTCASCSPPCLVSDLQGKSSECLAEWQELTSQTRKPAQVQVAVTSTPTRVTSGGEGPPVSRPRRPTVSTGCYWPQTRTGQCCLLPEETVSGV